MRCIICASLCFFLFNIYQTAGQSGRLESEYKLDIPQEDVSNLWDFVKSTYSKDSFNLAGISLSGEESIEIFIDHYFDLPDGRFSDAEISLRHRKRYKDDILLKELIQLKTPFSEDKVVRNEIKFDVKSKKKINDISNRHPLLKLMSASDQERMSFHLAKFKVRPEQVQESLKLKQTRKRIYIKDAEGESVATITLDEVSNFSFPFQDYAELELELNEIRYTNANELERSKMTELNNHIKSELATKFPRLEIDQRSKYRKMKLLIDNSKISYVYKNGMWLFFGVIISLSSFLFIKDHWL